MSGWIKLHRKITDNPLYFAEPFSRVQAWVDLLIIANHKAGFFRVRGIRVDIKRGQIGYTSETLAKRWKWSKGKVLRFLNELQNDTQIETQKNNITTLITILNYDIYQGDETQNETQNETQTERRRNADGTQTDPNKNVKNIKKEKKRVMSEVKTSEIAPADKKYFEIASSFFELIKQNMTDLKINSTDLAKAKAEDWITDIRLMMTTDKRTKEELVHVWQYLKNEIPSADGFSWKANIRSTKSLRAKFEKIMTSANKTLVKTKKRSNLEDLRATESRINELINNA
jgi:hypothetical protein